jgi:hypothetical protein
LRPGDKYNLATRRVISRAIDATALTAKFVDGLFSGIEKARGSMATIVVAQGGKVLFNKAYGVPPQPLYMPETAMPNFAVGAMGDALNAIVARSGTGRGGGGRAGEGAEPAAPAGRGAGGRAGLGGRGGAPGGMQRVAVDTVTGAISTNVDDLYRFEQALATNRAFTPDSAPSFHAPGTAFGWTIDRYKGFARQSVYGTADGKRNAYVRLPEQRAAIIILTNIGSIDARAMAEKIADKLVVAK